MPTPIETYILAQEPSVQPALLRMREVILENAPDCAERIAYGMPTFTGHGNLVHFAAHKGHIGFYPGADGVEAFLERLGAYKHSKGAIQFPLDQPVPFELVAEIARYRVRADAEDAERRKQARKRAKP